MTRREDRRVVAGFRAPATGPLTMNEWAWIDMLRTIVGDRDPVPTLAAVQALYKALHLR
jgi:hypothetical protein